MTDIARIASQLDGPFDDPARTGARAAAMIVDCTLCERELPHRWHWYEGCECSAHGAREDHDGDCPLARMTLIHDDRLIRERI